MMIALKVVNIIAIIIIAKTLIVDIINYEGCGL